MSRRAPTETPCSPATPSEQGNPPRQWRYHPGRGGGRGRGRDQSSAQIHMHVHVHVYVHVYTSVHARMHTQMKCICTHVHTHYSLDNQHQCYYEHVDVQCTAHQKPLVTYLPGSDNVAFIRRPIKMHHPASVALEQFAVLHSHHGSHQRDFRLLAGQRVNWAGPIRGSHRLIHNTYT